jgi:hypothetical protein
VLVALFANNPIATQMKSHKSMVSVPIQIALLTTVYSAAQAGWVKWRPVSPLVLERGNVTQSLRCVGENDSGF